MALLFIFAFLSGFVTILAPCIWPILPIVLSSTAGGGHRKPLGITLGVMVSFGFFTMSLSYIIRIIPFNPDIIRFIAAGVIAFFGLMLLIPGLAVQLETLMSRISSRFPVRRSGKNGGFWTGFITGLSLGVLWTPCSGPIFATIATLSATQAVNVNVLFMMVAYVIGVGIPLFLFATAGSSFFTKTKFFSRYTGRIQQIFGIFMILTSVSIVVNADKALEVKLLNFFPSYSRFLTDFENTGTVKDQLSALKQKSNTQSVNKKEGIMNQQKKIQSPLLNEDKPAPNFSGITKWLNTEKPLSLSDLKGKVVLIDFWTYTCINCLRTLPFVTMWYDKYHDKGFTVIGVHTPEFEFEKNTENVSNAIRQYGIRYPVAQDNTYGTWNAYENSYWPAEYLIDAEGNIRRSHFGEGEYDQTEQAIQLLLKEAGRNVPYSLVPMPDLTPKTRLSPETYVGSKRSEFFYPGGNLDTGKKTFTIVSSPPENTFSLGGEWDITDENAVTGSRASLTYSFFAKNVYLVLRPGPSGTQKKIRVLIDGKRVSVADAGKDVTDGILTVDSDRLYNLIELKGKAASHVLKLEFLDPGVEVFAFTFG